MKQKIGITRTPPLECLFNLIEEFFSCFDDILRENINKYLKTSTQPLDRNSFIQTA